MRTYKTALLLLLALVLLVSVFPLVGASQLDENQQRLVAAIDNAVVPTNKILADKKYNHRPIAELRFDAQEPEAIVEIKDADFQAYMMLQVPFLKELFKDGEIYALQIGETRVENNSLSQFNIMLAVAHETLGKPMGLTQSEFLTWLRSNMETLTLSCMDGKTVDVTVIARKDFTDPKTEYSLSFPLTFFQTTHTVTWIKNNGEADLVRSYDYGERIMRPIPKKEGYRLFWVPDVPATMGMTDLTFEALWIPENHARYTIKHYLMDEDGKHYSVDASEYGYGEVGTSVSATARTYPGFRYNASLSAPYLSGQITANDGLVLTVYYDRILYPIVWDFGFTTVTTREYYGVIPTPPELPTPPDDSYVLVGWEPELVPATERTSYSALYAKDLLTLHLDGNGGVPEQQTLCLSLGATYENLPEPTRIGHRFAGWFHEDGTALDPTDTVTAAGEERLIAHWTVNQYTITFDSVGGSPVPAITQAYGTEIIAPQDPEREGYIFIGWTPALPAQMPAQDLTVLANWHKHTWDNGRITLEPTCEESGTKLYRCTGCDAVREETLDALGHKTVDHKAQAPTCTEIGWDAYQTCRNCSYTTYHALPALGHDVIADAAVAPTCTEAGLTAGEHCSRCYYAVAQNEIPALGHEIVVDTAVAPTCTEAGLTAGEHCSRCDYAVAQNEIPALGHDWSEPTYAWAEDCSDITASRTCKRDAAHKESEAGVISSVITKEATYDAEGEITYTAVFQNPAFVTQTKAVATPKKEKPAPIENPFTDVKEDQYYTAPVLWAVERGITTGTSKTTFTPEDGCTRAQVVTFLWRAAGKPKPSGSNNPFADVKQSAYYYDAVLWAVENGITNGTDATTFSPEDTCTRAQIVTFLWRYEKQHKPSGSNNPFADVKQSAYYFDAVLWAVENGITNGTDATTFAPEDTCTRAQVVTFLYRDMAE